MPKAIWNDVILAESDETIRLEGNHYFPRDSVNYQYLRESPAHTTCPWKGVASYYDVVVNGDVNRGAAWFYPKPSRAAKKIMDHIAFWHGVKVVD